jgi:hypothetical protein
VKPGDLVLLRPERRLGADPIDVRWMLPGSLSVGDYSSEFPGGTPALFLGYVDLGAGRHPLTVDGQRVWILIGGRRGWVWDDELEECR